MDVSTPFFTRLRANFQRVALERHDSANSGSELRDEIRKLRQTLAAHRIALASAEQVLRDQSAATRDYLKASPSAAGCRSLLDLSSRSVDIANLVRAQLNRELV